MQRPCTPFSRVLNYSSSEIIYRTITSYTWTTIHQFSLVIPPLLLLHLLSRIVRAQLFDIFLLFLFCFLQQSWAPAKPALCNVVALPSRRSDFPLSWSGTSSPADHQPSSGWWHFPVSWQAKILQVVCQQNWGKWVKIFWHIWLVQ